MDSFEIYKVLYKVAGEAAGLVKESFWDDSSRKMVGDDTMKIDLESEQYIIDTLRSEGISGIFIAEETGVTEYPGSHKIIIDPLDGSRNYKRGIPWFSISIAVTPKNGSLRDVVAGIVYPPFNIEPIGFARGKGCFRGMVKTSPGKDSEYVFVYVDNPEAYQLMGEGLGKLKGKVIRSMGSAALEIALTGIGVGYAFIDLRAKLRVVDVAAACGVVWECGGYVHMLPGIELDSPLHDVERFRMVNASLDENFINYWDNIGGKGLK
jgi:myo-inositol-1(or 4)-monophosphatase